MPAWWDSLETVNGVTWWLKWIGAGLTFTGALCVIATLATTKRAETLKSERDAKSQAKAAETEKALTDLKQQTESRHLTPGLAKELRELARRHRGQTVIVIERSGSSEEARTFADFIAQAFQDGGWIVIRQKVSMIAAHPTYGLSCGYNKERHEKIISDLLSVFQEKRIRIEFWQYADKTQFISLDVGLKP